MPSFRSVGSRARSGGNRLRAVRVEHTKPSEATAKKTYQAILDEEIEQGTEELHRPAPGLALSALSAGLDVGLGVLVLAVIAEMQALTDALTLRFVQGLAYSVGFVFVIFGRSELFTEHTSLAVLPVLSGRVKPWRLGRLWGIVLCANLLGATVFALIASWLMPALGFVKASTLTSIAKHVVDHDASVIFVSGLVAGWMMGLLSWLVTAGRDTIGQVFFVVVVTGSIGFCGLHHCIVGTVEVLAALFATPTAITWPEYLHFLAPATLGNALGGAVFVALLKFGHARVSKLPR